MPRQDESAGYRSWRIGKTTLVFAVTLTAMMFGWQAYHLYESQQAAAERDSGECPTRAVESAYSRANASIISPKRSNTACSCGGTMPRKARSRRSGFDLKPLMPNWTPRSNRH